jgi:4-hydroxybenzoate polyprenyltransferase
MLGWFFALYLAFRVGEVAWSSLYVFSFGALFLYTTSLKKRPLVGNLVVAFFCAGVAILIWFAELPAWWALQRQSPHTAAALQSVLSWYAGFAFLSTLFREIVKDLEDREGDRAAGCRTLPIVAGERVAKYLATAVAALLIVSIGNMYLQQAPGFSPRFYIGALIGVISPLLYAIGRLPQARSAADYHLLSQLAKGVMLAGIFLLLL